MSIFPPLQQFSFLSPTGNALHKNKPVQNCVPCRKRKSKCDRLQPCAACKDRGEGHLCEPHVKPPVNRPSGYTHVSDTSILANRVSQLELAISRLIVRLDSPEQYHDILQGLDNPLPIFSGKQSLNEDGEKRNEESQSGSQFSEPPRPKRDTDRTGASSDISEQLVIDHQVPERNTFSKSPVVQQPQETLQNHGDLGFLELMTTPGPFVAPSRKETRFGTPVTTESYHHVNDSAELSANHFPPAPDTGGPFMEPVSQAASVHDHDAALALESLAIGRDAPASSDQIEGATFWGHQDTDTFASFVKFRRQSSKKERTVLFTKAKCLPSWVMCNYLLDHYFREAHFIYPCFHRPTYMTEIADLNAHLRLHTDMFTTQQLLTLALYAICLTVSIQVLSEEGQADIGLEQGQAEELAASCWDLCSSALEASDWMQVVDIRSCQVVIIAGTYLAAVRRANHHRALLGIATKIALSLGLFNVPEENALETNPSRWRNVIDREMGRRVWHSLVEYDWMFSIEHDYTYTIPLELSLSTAPANIDDEALHDGQPLQPATDDCYTQTSYFIHRLQLLKPLQHLVNQYRETGRMHYSAVMEAHQQLLQVISDRPAFFSNSDILGPGADAAQLSRIQRDSRMLSEATDLRTIRIHRYYFPASCHNSRYLLTKQCCLASAHRIIINRSTTVEKVSLVNDMNPKHWAVSYSTLIATMTGLVYLKYATPQEVKEYQHLCENGIRILRSLGEANGGTNTGDAAEILQNLIEIQLRRRTGNTPLSGQKRTFDEALEGWQTNAEQVEDLTAGLIAAMGRAAPVNEETINAILESWLTEVVDFN